jgi:magnesium chelatase family protein
MVGRARSVAVVGLQPVGVTVEAHVGPGLPGLHVIGSSGPAARESADRVRTALGTIGVTLPQRKALVSLAPAEVPKAGARFDLAMAVAILAELEAVPRAALAELVIIGELALDGGVRPVPGVLPSVASLQDGGAVRVMVAEDNAAEAALIAGVGVVPVAHLGEAVEILRGARPARGVVTRPPAAVGAPAPDLADVRGQTEARRALELAAAGGHHLLLVGPPGCGKSMLAARLPSLLPPLTSEQALELAAVRSVAGLLDDDLVLDRTPPFQAPHHGTTAAALLGGGSGVARPGAISRAHHGVLFLDELFEWPRSVLEALREPLEEGVVRIARAHATVRYPARIQVVAAANPCPCGGGGRCDCPEDRVWAYRARLSRPLADRLDLAPAVEPLTADDLLLAEPGEPSARVAARVAGARGVATERWGSGVTNAVAPAALVRRTAGPRALRVLADAVEAGELTGRGFDRALRVARTIADLAGAGSVGRDHALEARAHRMQLRPRAGAGLRVDSPA